MPETNNEPPEEYKDDLILKEIYKHTSSKTHNLLVILHVGKNKEEDERAKMLLKRNDIMYFLRDINEQPLAEDLIAQTPHLLAVHYEHSNGLLQISSFINQEWIEQRFYEKAKVMLKKIEKRFLGGKVDIKDLLKIVQSKTSLDLILKPVWVEWLSSIRATFQPYPKPKVYIGCNPLTQLSIAVQEIIQKFVDSLELEKRYHTRVEVIFSEAEPNPRILIWGEKKWYVVFIKFYKYIKEVLIRNKRFRIK